MHTSLAPAAAARALALVVRRVLSSPAMTVHVVPFGAAYAVSVGDHCLCTVSPSAEGVDLEWAPHSSEARTLLAPLLAAMIS